MYICVYDACMHAGGAAATAAAGEGRVLCFWEVDLGLNHVVKKSSYAVPASAHCLIAIPGGNSYEEGPGGVLVCCENILIYRKIDQEELACAYPRRLETGGDKGLMITAHAVHRMKGFFFILIQSECGDLYKIEVHHDEGVVRDIVCRYFDSLPVANALCVLKSGFLFLAAEFGNHILYQFTAIGADATDASCSSSHPLGRDAVIAFKPRALKNLVISDELVSYSPIIDMHILDAQKTGGRQIYLLCGRGPSSSLKIMQYGVATEELADNELPGRPKGVFTLKETNESAFDGYIIVSFEGSSLILRVGETIEEMSDSPFISNAATLYASLLFDDSYIQVIESEVRHIKKNSAGQYTVSLWKPSGLRRIRCVTANKRQIAVGLTGGDLILFELDEAGTLIECSSKSLHVEITCLTLQQVREGRTRASFLAVGGLDNVVRIFAIDKDKQLKQQSTQLLPAEATPESVCLATLHPENSNEQPVYLYVRLYLFKHIIIIIILLLLIIIIIMLLIIIIVLLLMIIMMLLLLLLRVMLRSVQ